MYSGKARGYMNYKGLNFLDKKASIFDMATKIKPNTGERVVPVLESKSGDWIQDTTIILDYLERRHPERSISVATPRQYAVSLLLEVWADEYWVPIAMHYRWSFKEENEDLITSEVGASLFPFLPNFLQSYLGRRVTSRLDEAAPIIGFVPEQFKMLEDWTEKVLDLLERHFSQHDYLLGGRPTVADFALLASFYGHLNRDPAPKRMLMPSRPNLTDWVERTHRGDTPSGDLLPNDAVPDTLVPILKLVCDEFLSMVEAYRAVLQIYISDNGKQSGDEIPRFLEFADFPMGEDTFTRQTMPYTLWMMQRAQKVFRAGHPGELESVNQWMAQTFGTGFLDLDPGPALVRTGLSTKLA